MKKDFLAASMPQPPCSITTDTNTISSSIEQIQPALKAGHTTTTITANLPPDVQPSHLDHHQQQR